MVRQKNGWAGTHTTYVILLCVLQLLQYGEPVEAVCVRSVQFPFSMSHMLEFIEDVHRLCVSDRHRRAMLVSATQYVDTASLAKTEAAWTHAGPFASVQGQEGPICSCVTQHLRVPVTHPLVLLRSPPPSPPPCAFLLYILCPPMVMCVMCVSVLLAVLVFALARSERARRASSPHPNPRETPSSASPRTPRPSPPSACPSSSAKASSSKKSKKKKRKKKKQQQQQH